MVPFFHLHLETTALHFPLICPSSRLGLQPLEVPYARSQRKTGPELTSRTLTRHLPCTHTFLEPRVCLSNRAAHPTPAAPVPRGFCGTHRPTCPSLHQSPSDGRSASGKSILTTRQNPRIECCPLRAKEQLLTEARWGQVFKSTVAGGTETLLGPGRSKNHGSKTDILVL